MAEVLIDHPTLGQVWLKNYSVASGYVQGVVKPDKTNIPIPDPIEFIVVRVKIGRIIKFND